MREFMNYLLQSFKDATGWNRDNVYSDLNETANELLNFQTPGGLRLTLSSLATPHFATSYTLGSVGVVDGSISYLYCSVPLTNLIAQSVSIPLPTLLRSYRQLRELPHASSILNALDAARSAPTSATSPKNSILEGARRVIDNPTLLYGRLYLPRSMLEALVIKRITPLIQMQLMAVSEAQLRNGGTMLGMLQFDKGKYGIEGLASTDSGLLGVRGLYNFGGDASAGHGASAGSGSGGLLEDSGVGITGEKERIYGRFSVGGEIYYGTLNKSGGISLGARFATLPSHRGTPLTATLTINPLMGNICASYAVVAREYCSLATKFDFNVYSYESDWAVGMELWSKRRLAGLVGVEEPSEPESPQSQRRERSFQAKLEWRLDDPKPIDATTEGKPLDSDTCGKTEADDEYHGVLKARLNQHLKIGLLWEGRMKALVFSLGTGVDLHKLDQPFRSVGLEIQFSS